MSQSKIVKLAQEVAALRVGLLERGVEEGSITMELSNNDLSAIVYSLAVAWLSEYVSSVKGEEQIMALIGQASATLIAADVAPHIDEAINRILGEADAA